MKNPAILLAALLLPLTSHAQSNIKEEAVSSITCKIILNDNSTERFDIMAGEEKQMYVVRNSPIISPKVIVSLYSDNTANVQVWSAGSQRRTVRTISRFPADRPFEHGTTAWENPSAAGQYLSISCKPLK